MTDRELAEKIAACVKCGSCRSVCTLYPERRTEVNVARGKIALLESAMAGEIGLPTCGAIPLREERDAAVQEALTDCLLCGRCERNCPNQVAVEEILVAGRTRFADKLGLPAWKRILFDDVLPSASALNAVRAAGNVAQHLLRKVSTESGLHYRFPDVAGLHGRTLPALPPTGFVASLGNDEARAGEVMLFPGCVFDLVMPEIGRDSYETLKAAWGEVMVSRDAACCGLPALASGDRAGGMKAISKNLVAMRAAAPRSIVFPCGSCLKMFRRDLLNVIPTDHPLRDAAEWVAERCVDYATSILDSPLVRILAPASAAFGAGSVGWHDPCHLSGTLGRGEAGRELLERAVGKGFGEMKGADRCCGYGGTFNARDYPTSARIGENKISLAVQGGTSTIVTECSGCILQLRDMAARVSRQTRVRHLAQVVRSLLPA